MTRDEIIKLAREAGGLQEGFYVEIDVHSLEHFAALVAKHERESCASFLELGTESACLSSDPGVRVYTVALLKGLANSIRAKGGT